MNVDNMRRLADLLEQQVPPQNFSMENFFSAGVSRRDFDVLLINQIPCNTVACIAGIGALMALADPNWPQQASDLHPDTNPSVIAQAWLGLKFREAQTLFAPSNTRSAHFRAKWGKPGHITKRHAIRMLRMSAALGYVHASTWAKAVGRG